MIPQLKKAMSKILTNPRYIWYLWQNVNIARDHFPSIYKRFHQQKSWDIGTPTNLRRLHVILRTTDFVMNLNATRQLDNIGIKTRNDVILAGGCSIFPAAAHFAATYGRENIQVTLVVDRLSDMGMRQYNDAAENAHVVFDVVSAKGSGNEMTFQTQIDLALQDTDDTLALILENDYMLDTASLTTCFKIMKDHSRVIGMTPHFHPDRVRRQDIGKLAVIDGKMYCQVPSTCCTFFMHVGAMRRFEKFLRLYDGFEAGSVNVAWTRGLCLAPLGWTLAEHLHRCDLSPVGKYGTLQSII